MIFEVQLSIASFYLPCIRDLSAFNLCLHRVLLLHVQYIPGNQKLSKDESSQGETVSEVVRHIPVYLAGNDTSCVTNCLLETD